MAWQALQKFIRADTILRNSRFTKLLEILSGLEMFKLTIHYTVANQFEWQRTKEFI